MYDLRTTIKEQCPNVDVVSAGAWDAYKEDIAAIARENPRQHIILVGHSFGCAAIDQAATKLPKVDLAVFIDPSWDDFTLAPTIRDYLWFKRSDIGIEREATIVGAWRSKVIKGGHNDLPHSQSLIAELIQTINKIDRSNRKNAIAKGS
jgi:pimeloyl-ACP methyl ester carboxylesterase